LNPGYGSRQYSCGLPALRRAPDQHTRSHAKIPRDPSFDPPTSPDGDLRHFDYDAAARDHAENSGRYTVRGNQLYIQMGSSQQPELITTEVPRAGRLVVNTVVYLRQ
jgi:hypothetical protein